MERVEQGDCHAPYDYIKNKADYFTSLFFLFYFFSFNIYRERPLGMRNIPSISIHIFNISTHPLTEKKKKI
jgi:hypothetical protein